MRMFRKNDSLATEHNRQKDTPPPTSVVAFGMSVQGQVKPYGQKAFRIHVDGRMEGDIEADEVVIGDTGRVTGNINARNVVIKGHFTGDVEGDDVQIGPSAKVEGNILYDRIKIEQADISANLRKRQPAPPTETRNGPAVERTPATSDAIGSAATSTQAMLVA